MMDNTDWPRRPIAVSGPSGVGKGTLINMLIEHHPEKFSKTVSHTTRRPRPGEVGGETYHFVTVEEFGTLVEAGAFVEHTIFAGNYYGTSFQAITDQQAQQKVPILEIEMNGIITIQQNPDINARCVFIAPPSLQILEERLRGRGTEAQESINARLEQAKIEIDFGTMSGAYHAVIVNHRLEKAYKHLERWVSGSRQQSYGQK